MYIIRHMMASCAEVEEMAKRIHKYGCFFLGG